MLWRAEGWMKYTCCVVVTGELLLALSTAHWLSFANNYWQLLYPNISQRQNTSFIAESQFVWYYHKNAVNLCTGFKSQFTIDGSTQKNSKSSEKNSCFTLTSPRSNRLTPFQVLLLIARDAGLKLRRGTIDHVCIWTAYIPCQSSISYLELLQPIGKCQRDVRWMILTFSSGRNVIGIPNKMRKQHVVEKSCICRRTPENSKTPRTV